MAAPQKKDLIGLGCGRLNPAALKPVAVERATDRRVLSGEDRVAVQLAVGQFGLGPEVQRFAVRGVDRSRERSEERRVGKECRSRWSPYH